MRKKIKDKDFNKLKRKLQKDMGFAAGKRQLKANYKVKKGGK